MKILSYNYEKVYLSLLIFAIMFLKHCVVLDLEKFLWKKIEWKGNARKPWLILAHPKTHCNYYGATSLVLSKINLYCIFVLFPSQWYVFLKKHTKKVTKRKCEKTSSDSWKIISWKWFHEIFTKNLVKWKSFSRKIALFVHFFSAVCLL